MIVWMGERLLFADSIVLCLVLRFFFEQLRKIVLTYKDAAGMWWHDKWRPLVGCLVNLILNLLLVKTIGVAGVAISTVISYALVEMPWETHVLFKYYFKKSEREYYREILISTITLLISGVITYICCNNLPIDGVLAILIKLIMCVLLPNIIFVILNVKNEFYLESKNLLIKILKTMRH